MKKKLAIVVTHPIQYYAPLFKLLTDRGNIDIKVFYSWGEESIKPKFDPGFRKTIEWDIPLLEGYEYEFLTNASQKPGSNSFNGIKNPDAITRINAYRPDVLLIYGWSNQSHLNLIRYFKGKIPVWFRGDSNLIDDQKGWKSILRKAFLRWVYSNVDKALYVGSANKAYFEKFGLKPQQLAFVPHSIDNDRFSIKYESSEIQVRKSLNIADTDTLILFAGKLEPKKNPEILLQAFAKLNMHSVHLLLVGNGVLEKSLKQMVLKENIQNVHFLDFKNQRQMPSIYQSCDIFCLPSAGPGETWGLAVNEAMAAGKSIIVSDKVGCAKDLVIPGKNGYIFASSDKEELFMLLKEFAQDKQRIQDMGKTSSRIIQEWSFSTQAVCLENELMNF